MSHMWCLSRKRNIETILYKTVFIVYLINCFDNFDIIYSLQSIIMFSLVEIFESICKKLKFAIKAESSLLPQGIIITS